MRKIAVFLVLACAAFGQKKPVTLEALQDFRSTVARDVPGEPVWAPDGKTFVYRQGRRLRLFDVAAKKSREVVDLSTLDAAAVNPPAARNGMSGRTGGWMKLRCNGLRGAGRCCMRAVGICF